MMGNEQGPGGEKGPGREKVPPLVDVNQLGFGGGSQADIAFALEVGMTPEDLKTLSEYLYSLNNP